MVAVGDRYWAYLVARAVPVAAIAVFITFSADHSVGVGWLSLVVLCSLAGVVVLVGSARMTSGRPRLPLLLQGGVLVVGAVLAAVLLSASLGALTAVLAGVFVASGALELVAGLRSRGLSPVARDWIFLGALSVAFGIAVVLIPVDYSQVITVPGKDVPNLTASVVVVGALGAYAAIAAVYLVIAGLSLKWARHPDAAETVESAS